MNKTGMIRKNIVGLNPKYDVADHFGEDTYGGLQSGQKITDRLPLY